MGNKCGLEKLSIFPLYSLIRGFVRLP